MAVIVVSTFEVSGLSAPALDILKAAVLYAQQNRPAQMHTMNVDAFCYLAGLPPTPVEHFWSLLKEACRALLIVEGIDTSDPHREDLPSSSWPVFDGVWIDGCEVMFEVCKRTFTEGLLSDLPNLRPPVRQRHRKMVLFGRQLRRKSSTVTYWKPAVLG